MVGAKQEGAAAPEPYRWSVVRPGHLSAAVQVPFNAARRLIAWFRRHPQIADALLGAALLLVAVLTVIGAPESSRVAGHDKDPGVLGFALILIMTFALTWRRRAPFTVLAVITAADIVYYQLGFMSTAADFLAVLIMAYTVGSRRPGWLGVLVLAAAVLTYSTAAIAKDGKISDVTGGLVIIAASWAIGRSVGLRRAYVSSLEERATQVEHLREAELRDVVHEERARIARELHDVVAHHVSVMTVQASAALRQLDRDPERSREALTSVEEVGRAALSEMRRMVGVLREINAAKAAAAPYGQVRPDTSEPLPGPRVLILTTFDLDEYVVEGLRVGASGFLLKDAPPQELVNAIRIVARGDAIVAPSVTRRLLDRFASRLPSADAPTSNALRDLTAREIDVLRLVARGLSNAEIADELVVSETTVKTHVGHLLTKLRLRDRVQAAVFAYESGLVTPGTL